jgi:Domain of unknown function (DUF1996)
MRPSHSRTIAARAALICCVLAVLPVAMPVARADQNGVFHTSCTFSHMAKDDPIVSPGEPGVSHLHLFFGNETTDADSTYRSMRRGTTSCDVSADTAGYWTPALVDPHGNVIRPKRLTAYYFASTSVTAPPADLRVIAGGDTSDLRIAGYACGEGMPTSSVPMDCGSQWLKGVIVFPSCWNGDDLDSRNHRSHMAYPTGKGCPKGFRVRLPKLALHVTYGIHDGTGDTLVSDEMMGMTDGMSLHADFWNTWDQSKLEDAVDRCLNGHLTCDL